MEERVSKWEMKGAEKNVERLTAKVDRVSFHCVDDTFDTSRNIYKVEG